MVRHQDHLHSGEDNAEQERFLAAASRVRAVLEGTRSDRLRRLFDYLLEKTLAGESPTEQQIAVGAFQLDGQGNEPDVNARVYIHRLRKLLDSEMIGSTEPRLFVPVGEYCLRLAGGNDGSAPSPPSHAGAWSWTGLGQKRRRWVIVAVILACLAAVWLAWTLLDRGRSTLAETISWQTIADDRKPITVVVGDYYLFARVHDNQASDEQEPELILDRNVPSREDLTILRILNPENADAVVDHNQQFVSSGTVEALTSVREALAQLPNFAQRAIRLVGASQLTPEMLASSDVIYVGQLSGMSPLLREPLIQASGFRIDRDYARLTDLKSGSRFQTDAINFADETISKRDFAYLANFPGPAGNRILVIAGIGDAGVKEGARLVGNLDQMADLSRRSGRSISSFETLYRVRTIRNVNVGASLLIVRPLRSGGMWDNSGSATAYRPIQVEPNGADKP